MSEAKRKKAKKKSKQVEKVDQEEVLLNELLRQERLSDEESFNERSGPNEFERLVEQVEPNVKKTFKDRIKVPEKVLAPKTFIISQNAELKIIDHVKEERDKQKMEKLRQKESNRFRYYQVGYAAGTEDQGDDFDQEEEEYKARHRFVKDVANNEEQYLKKFKPHKNDQLYTSLQNERHHNQKLAIAKQKLLENNINFDDLVKPDIIIPSQSTQNLKLKADSRNIKEQQAQGNNTIQPKKLRPLTYDNDFEDEKLKDPFHFPPIIEEHDRDVNEDGLSYSAREQRQRAEKNGFKQVQLLNNDQENERARLVERKKQLEKEKFDKHRQQKAVVIRRVDKEVDEEEVEQPRQVMESVKALSEVNKFASENMSRVMQEHQNRLAVPEMLPIKQNQQLQKQFSTLSGVSMGEGYQQEFSRSPSGLPQQQNVLGPKDKPMTHNQMMLMQTISSHHTKVTDGIAGLVRQPSNINVVNGQIVQATEKKQLYSKSGVPVMPKKIVSQEEIDKRKLAEEEAKVNIKQVNLAAERLKQKEANERKILKEEFKRKQMIMAEIKAPKDEFEAAIYDNMRAFIKEHGRRLFFKNELVMKSVAANQSEQNKQIQRRPLIDELKFNNMYDKSLAEKKRIWAGEGTVKFKKSDIQEWFKVWDETRLFGARKDIVDHSKKNLLRQF